MKLLAIDTATTSCSVALVVDQAIRAERTVASGQTHNRHLMAMVAGVLAQGALRLDDVDLLAVTRGPGSFTGLRIGMATVQALALAAAKPVVAVSSLEALAVQAAVADGVVAAMVDARRGEVYSATYRVKDGQVVQLAPEAVLKPAAAVRRVPVPCRLVGSGARTYAVELGALLGAGACLAPPEMNILTASNVARLARRQADQAVAPERLVPCYLRPADAVRHRRDGGPGARGGRETAYKR